MDYHFNHIADFYRIKFVKVGLIEDHLSWRNYAWDSDDRRYDRSPCIFASSVDRA